jgi:hypothetical protein
MTREKPSGDMSAAACDTWPIITMDHIAIGPAPHWSGRRREHSSIVLASIAVIPGTNKIVSNQPSSLSAGPCATPHIMAHVLYSPCLKCPCKQSLKASRGPLDLDNPLSCLGNPLVAVQIHSL